ncbi:MAG: DUF5710 domain-containing protein [Alphaproteobacteria bacterium]|nr:DUF5710 domain-containing protein [Alphaproteobacteria bacterium]
MEDEKIYLNCPFDDKDACKSLGGRWDSDARKWYITDAMASEPFAQWMEGAEAPAETGKPQAETEEGEKTYLNCPFDDKDACKALGGRWDGDAKKWYVPAEKDTAPFSRWM